MAFASHGIPYDDDDNENNGDKDCVANGIMYVCIFYKW